MSLVQMSLSGGLIILAAAVIRALGKNRLPRQAFTVLWAIAALRLVLPVDLPSPWSVYTLFAAPAPSQTAAVEAVPGNAAAAGYIPAAHQVDIIQKIPAQTPGISISPWAILWTVGAIICAVVFAVLYVRCCRAFRASLPVESESARRWLDSHRLLRTVDIRRSDRIAAPLTYGVLRPVILLPRGMDLEDSEALDYVLSHELAHIRRFDAAWKLALAGVACLHWFNPAVWVMYALAGRDMELACDEAVIRRHGPEARKAYARVLLAMEEARGGFAPQASFFNRNAIEERIISVMKIKPKSIFSIILAAVLVLGTVTAFATSASAAEIPADEPQTVIDDINITDEDYEIPFPTPVIEWWTAEEYAAWLEQEKLALQDCLGSRAWTGHDGWFTWTQEKIDETVAMYEQILEDIQNGALISKTVDGSTDVMLASGGLVSGTVFATEDELASAFLEDRTALWAETLEPYAPFGVIYTYDPATDDFKLYWNDKEVRGITDEDAQLWISEHAGLSSYGDDAIELYAVYENGKLVGLREATDWEQESWTHIRQAVGAYGDYIVDIPPSSEPVGNRRRMFPDKSKAGGHGSVRRLFSVLTVHRFYRNISLLKARRRAVKG